MAEITFTHGVFNEKQVSCIHSFCLIEKVKQVSIVLCAETENFFADRQTSFQFFFSFLASHFHHNNSTHQHHLLNFQHQIESVALHQFNWFFLHSNHHYHLHPPSQCQQIKNPFTTTGSTCTTGHAIRPECSPTFLIEWITTNPSASTFHLIH